MSAHLCPPSRLCYCTAAFDGQLGVHPGLQPARAEQPLGARHSALTSADGGPCCSGLCRCVRKPINAGPCVQGKVVGEHHYRYTKCPMQPLPHCRVPPPLRPICTNSWGVWPTASASCCPATPDTQRRGACTGWKWQGGNRRGAGLIFVELGARVCCVCCTQHVRV